MKNGMKGWPSSGKAVKTISKSTTTVMPKNSKGPKAASLTVTKKSKKGM